MFFRSHSDLAMKIKRLIVFQDSLQSISYPLGLVVLQLFLTTFMDVCSGGM